MKTQKLSEQELQEIETIQKRMKGVQRGVHTWYNLANRMCEENCYNLFNPNFTSYTWENVLKVVN
jgi:hypothetical protein